MKEETISVSWMWCVHNAIETKGKEFPGSTSIGLTGRESTKDKNYKASLEACHLEF